MRRINNVSNNFKGEYCVDCMEPIQNCCCNEIAFTKLDVLEVQGNRYFVLGESAETARDCDTCTSFGCTECPRYTCY